MDAYIQSTSSQSQSASATITCPHCHLSLDSSEALNIHLHLHTAIMQGFPCRYCGKVYSTEESLLSHQSTHATVSQPTGVQPGSPNTIISDCSFQTTRAATTLQSDLSASSSFASYTNFTSIPSMHTHTGVVCGMTRPPIAVHPGLDERSQFKGTNISQTDSATFPFGMPLVAQSKCNSPDVDNSFVHSDGAGQSGLNPIQVSLPKVQHNSGSAKVSLIEQVDMHSSTEITCNSQRGNLNSLRPDQTGKGMLISANDLKKESNLDTREFTEGGEDAEMPKQINITVESSLIPYNSTQNLDSIVPVAIQTNENFQSASMQITKASSEESSVENFGKTVRQHWSSVQEQMETPGGNETVQSEMKDVNPVQGVTDESAFNQDNITDVENAKESERGDYKRIEEDWQDRHCSPDNQETDLNAIVEIKIASEEHSQAQMVGEVDGENGATETFELNGDDEDVKDVLQCSSCGQQFKTQGGLKRHIARKHKLSTLTKYTRGKKETCSHCPMQFKTKAQLDSRKRTHDDMPAKRQTRQRLRRKVAQHAKSYANDELDTASESDRETSTSEKAHKCEQCNKSFKNLKSLNMHKRTHKRLRQDQENSSSEAVSSESADLTRVDNLFCKECDKIFKTERGFAKHMSNHEKTAEEESTEVKKNKNSLCELCGESFKLKKALIQHMRADHKEEAESSRERNHVCSSCGKAFLEKSHLTEHERRHGEADVPCPKCDKKFKCESDLRKHQRAHSDNKPYVCKTCGSSFKASSHLAEHTLRHGEAKFECQYCDKKYFIKRELMKHERAHMSKTYPCPHCREEFREKPSLQEHIKEHEESGTVKQFICSHCNLYFSSEKGLNHHLNNNHRELLPPEEQWQFICEECKRVCPSEDALKCHKRVHQEGRVFPCSICEKFFKSPQHLQEHEKRHGEPTLSCSICSWKFVLECDLKKHEKRHSRTKSLPCTLCEKKFTTNGALNAHIKRHTQSASSFVCTHCKLGFRSSLGLKYHLNHKHFEQLPQNERWTHLCDHCNKVFPTKSSVLRHKQMQGKYACQMCNLTFRTEKAHKQHKQIHLGLRSHCCAVCGKGFMKSHHLAEHVKRHGDGSHQCKLCAKKYVFLTDLRKHMKLSHFSSKLEQCAQCDQKFLSERMLRQHILLHHQVPSVKQYVCYDCNLQFSGSKGLISHMNNKHAEKLSEKERWKFKCDICNRLCRSANALEAHGQVHSNFRPHECTQCGKRFKEARHLLEHKMRHGEGQYPCPKCDKKYVFERDLTKHIRTHSDVKQFECSQCSKSFATNTDLNSHLLRHEQAKNDPDADKDKTLQCAHCSLKFVHKKGLDTHLNNKHRDLLVDDQRWPFWCEQCKRAFRTEAAMKKHEPEHLGKRNFKCSFCSKTFKEARHLAEHQRRHEKPTLQCKLCDKKYVLERDLQKHEKTHCEEKPFKCPKCIRQYALKTALETHMKQHEHTAAKYICWFCALGFISNKCLQNHLNNQHREKLKPADQWNHICKFCSKAYPTELGLVKHEKVHRSLKVHRCKICNKHFKLAHHLSQHEKRHQEGELECEYCKKKYVFASDLRKHVRIHTGEKPFNCDYCGKRFRVSGGLRKHLRLHEQSKLPKPDRPHKCQFCKKSFRFKEKLTAHLSIHGEKQFICNICSKIFCFEKTLQRHVLTHNTIKAFACNLCTRQFADEVALSRHIDKHEKGLLKTSVLEKSESKRFQCNYCTLSFVSEYKWKYHVNNKHRDVLQSMDDSVKWSHVCRFCNKAFATESAWQRHEMTHGTKDQQVVYQCLLCPKKFQTSEQFTEHERSHHEQAQQQEQQQLYVCKFCSKSFVNVIDFRQHENAHASDAIVTVPLQGDLTYRQDGLVQVSLRDAGFEGASNQQLPRATDGQFELLAELISATSNILTLNN